MFSSAVNSAAFADNPGQSNHNINPDHRGKTKGELALVFDNHGFRSTTPVRVKGSGAQKLIRTKFGDISDSSVYQGKTARSGQRGLVVVFLAPP